MTDDTEDCGPAMLALTHERRAFVIELLDNPMLDHTALYMRCYPNVSRAAATVNASRLLREPKLLAAYHEEAEKRLRSGAILGASVLIEIARNPQHKDQLKAANALLNRIGLHEKSEHHVVTEKKLNSAEMIEEITKLAKFMNVDPATLLGQNSMPALPAPIDAEFVEVKGSTEGLEDIL